MINIRFATLAAILAAAPARGAEVDSQAPRELKPCSLVSQESRYVGHATHQEYVIRCPGTEATRITVSFEQEGRASALKPRAPAQSLGSRR